MLEITGTILITHNAFFGALFATANNLVTIGRQKYKLLADTFLILCFNGIVLWSFIKCLGMSKNEVDQLCAEVFERCAHYNISIIQTSLQIVS